MISQDQIHYTKSSIRRWQGETPRLQINMDVVGVSSAKIHKLCWKMTQEKREMWNCLEEDQDWPLYKEAEQLWENMRSAQGHSVKLWIGKLHERNSRFIPGRVQNSNRLPYAISLLALHRSSEKLCQFLWWEDWQHEQEFHHLQAQDYNRVWDWRNPLSSKIGQSRTKRITL